jgi:hypothetical protein
MTVDVDTMTGYATADRYYATRYTLGGRTVYSIDLSLDVVAMTLPKPDPNRPTPGNRRVSEKHARSFARYVRENESWVAPALLLRSPDIFTFEVEKEVAGTQFGVLSLPRLARTDLKILDGQHRILGFHYAVEELAAELDRNRSQRAEHRRNENPDLERHFDGLVRTLERQRERLSRERISIQVHIEDDPKAFHQMFVDIADNALGITSALRARFDTRKVVNRALEDVLKHSLLQERVDMEQDRIGGSSPFLMGAKHVADVIRTVTVGIQGRVGRRQEDELREAELVEKTNAFLDTLVEGFDVLDQVVEGKKVPEALRKESLLGSTTLLRVLAGVYHELATSKSDDEIAEFFSKLAPHMSAPVTEESRWLETEVFEVGATAPRARRQDLETLTEKIVEWALRKPAWLYAKAAGQAVPAPVGDAAQGRNGSRIRV